MFTIHRSQLPADEATVRAALATYVGELEEHKTTVGVPAPWPEFDVLRSIVAAGGELEVIDPQEEPVPQAELTLLQRRARAWESIKAERERRTTQGGYQAAGMWFHSDGLSRIQQLGLLIAGQNMPPCQWKTMNGTFIPMTPQLAQQIFAAACASDIAMFTAAEAHRVAMEAAEDPDVYDFSGDWPLVFGEVE